MLNFMCCFAYQWQISNDVDRYAGLLLFYKRQDLIYLSEY